MTSLMHLRICRKPAESRSGWHQIEIHRARSEAQDCGSFQGTCSSLCQKFSLHYDLRDFCFLTGILMTGIPPLSAIAAAPAIRGPYTAYRQAGLLTILKVLRMPKSSSSCVRAPARLSVQFRKPQLRLGTLVVLLRLVSVCHCPCYLIRLLGGGPTQRYIGHLAVGVSCRTSFGLVTQNQRE